MLSPKYGAIGAAIGTCFGLLAYQIIINVYYQKKLRLDIRTFFHECHLKILPLLIVFTVIAYYLQSLITLDSWIKLITCGSIYVVIFLLICYVLLFNKEEKMFIKSLKRK